MDNLMGSQSVLSTIAVSTNITFIWSCMYFLSLYIPRFQKAATRMHYSSTYPVYGQLGGFSMCPFYHSISRTHHIYTVSLLYVRSHVSVATKVSESFSHRNGNSTVEISMLCRHFLEVIYL